MRIPKIIDRIASDTLRKEIATFENKYNVYLDFASGFIIKNNSADYKILYNNKSYMKDRIILMNNLENEIGVSFGLTE